MNLNKREQSLLQAFYDVEKFNEIAGAQHNYQTVLDKLKIVLEEVNEGFCAFFPDGVEGRFSDGDVNKKELLDSAVDILYTVFALPRELEALGYDVFGALDTVCVNNDSKFVKTVTEAEMSVRHYQSQGIECKSVYNEKYNCYSIVDSNNKVRKPIGFKSVELDKFLPKEN